MNDNEWKTLIALGVVNCFHAAHFYTIEFIEDRSAEMAGAIPVDIVDHRFSA